MQAYHGKGLYDAEGGLIKYYVRLEMRRRGASLANLLDVVSVLRACTALTTPSLGRYAKGQLSNFTINQRVFHAVGEEDVSFARTQSELSLVKPPAGYTGTLSGSTKMYCVAFDDFPKIAVGKPGPFQFGVPAAAALPDHRPAALAGPYEAAAIVCSGVAFTGRWRKISCLCPACRGDSMVRVLGGGRIQHRGYPGGR